MVLAPYVIYQDPGPNASNVIKNAAIRVTFSTDIDQSTINSNSFLVLNSHWSQIDGTYEYDARTVVFRPLQNLTMNSTYMIKLMGSIKSTDGTGLLEEYFWQFDTRETDLFNGPSNFENQSFAVSPDNAVLIANNVSDFGSDFSNLPEPSDGSAIQNQVDMENDTIHSTSLGPEKDAITFIVDFFKSLFGLN
jgi:hypothetical protein